MPNDFLPIGSLAGRTGAPVGGGVLYPNRLGGQRMPPTGVQRGDSIFAPTFQPYRTDLTPQNMFPPIVEMAGNMPAIGAGSGGAGGSMRSAGGGGGGSSGRMGDRHRVGTFDGRIHGGVSPPSQGTRPGGFSTLPPVQGMGVFGFGGQGDFQQPSQRMLLPGYADGGRPPVGQPVVVGERGPEVVTFDPAGPNVIPNEALPYGPMPGLRAVGGWIADHWPNFAEGGYFGGQPAAPAAAPATPVAARPSAYLPPSAPLTGYTPKVMSPGEWGMSQPSIFDQPPPMASASGGSAAVPQVPQNVPRGTNPGRITNAYTMGAPVQFEAATAWARRLFQNAAAFPENKELLDQAQKAAQWAGMTTAQRTAALAHGEREVAKAERLGQASAAVQAQQEDPVLWARLAEFNRTGVLPEETRGTITRPWVPPGAPMTGQAVLNSTYGTGSANYDQKVAPNTGTFETPYGPAKLDVLQLEDARRNQRLQRLWDQRNLNLRRQSLRR